MALAFDDEDLESVGKGVLAVFRKRGGRRRPRLRPLRPIDLG